MSFNQSVILDYSPELLEVLQEWEPAQIDIDFVNLGNDIQVFYNNPYLLFLLGRAYQVKLLNAADIFETKEKRILEEISKENTKD